MNKKSVAANLALSIAAVVFTFLVLEAALRLYQWTAFDVPFWNSLENINSSSLGPITLDPALGWRATPNYRYDGPVIYADGTSHWVDVTTNASGFRAFGDLHSVRPKILVIGDSFTEADQVPDGKTYYSVLGRLVGAEIFAYGADGYGTLQEYMVLSKYVDEINPDLVILQYCPNDVIDNSLDLGIASKAANSGMVRPYWLDGRVEYAMAKAHPGLRMFGLKYSRLAYWVLTRLDMIKASWAGRNIDVLDAAEHFEPQAEARAREVTRELMEMVRKRGGGRPVISFSTARRAEAEAVFEELSRGAGIPFVKGVGLSVQARQVDGQTVRVMDGHWNEAGNLIVADDLSKYIRENKLLSQTGHDGAVRTPGTR